MDQSTHSKKLRFIQVVIETDRELTRIGVLFVGLFVCDVLESEVDDSLC